MLEETVSNWQCVVDKIKEEPPIVCGPQMTELFYEDPERLINEMTYYKFAAKMFGTTRTILDLGCREGFGSYLLSKECGAVYGVDSDITISSKNFQNHNLKFFTNLPHDLEFDALVCFNATPELAIQMLPSYSMAIVGFCPHEDNTIEITMRREFQFVFPFIARSEILQPCSNNWHQEPYVILLGCKRL